MGIQATARSAVLQAFAAAGDAKVETTLRLGPGTPVYDPEADTNTITWEQETAGLLAVPFSDKTMKQQVDLSTRTRSFIYQGSEITASNPNQSGEIVDENSQLWQIVRADSDPTASVWIFHCTA